MCWLLSAKKQFPLSHTDVIVMWYVFSDAESGVPDDSDSLSSDNSDSELSGEPALERYTCSSCCGC